ncbi:hypothetical protein ASZ78_002812 [Callipepla squamata]|uniref:Peptidase M12B domain-containing protein n=1 Tax=Callipepla squamata TaxID=9009 RepID=A0A226MG79_CALSU|nr:hypothetical protein ASZ78_002812 [Callipepla squamata]
MQRMAEETQNTKKCLFLVEREGKECSWQLNSHLAHDGARNYESPYSNTYICLQTKYDDTMEYGIKANGEEVILHLQKNKHLLAGDYTETVYSDDGRQITTSPQIKDHCYYEGYIQDEADSIASINACKGLSGYFETRGQKYLIEPLGTSDRDKHAVYEYVEDKSIKTCGVTNSSWEVNASDPISNIFKSSNSPEVSTEQKSKATAKVDEGVSEGKKISGSLHRCRQYCGGETFSLVQVYKAINIYVALVGLEIWTDNDKCSLSPIAGSTLDSFSKWRNSDLLKRKRNDNAQLITYVSLLFLLWSQSS